MQLVLATNNPDKIREIKELLADLPVTILIRDDFLEFPDIEETGTTLKENAVLKARTIADFCDLPALADDSGLEVEALGGAPGVFSSRYAGNMATYRDNNEKLLRELGDRSPEQRTACFRCVIAIAWNQEDIQTVEGRVDGFISMDISGTDGFGYDPVFIHKASGRRFAEMSLAEKNAVSHRGVALKKARTLILNKLRR